MVRLTAGIWRGRKLAIPQGIRPTTELARKAAFDILGEAVVGARVLDACAGSGAYGLEALSRGAAHATFVEADREVAKVLRGNVQRLGTGERATIKEMTVARFSSKDEEGRERREDTARAAGGSLASGRPVAPRFGLFDVVFHDPPFGEIPGSSEFDLQLLISLVRPGGWLFHERGDDEVLRPSGLPATDRRRYGTTRFLVFRPSRDHEPC
jgi:16S rRNA (guanine966-N2)-methyltransferase